MGERTTKRGGLLEIFSDIHLQRERDRLDLEVTFAIDPAVEQMAAAFYMDGSESMRQAGNYGRGGGLFNLGRRFNPVESAMRAIVPYIAGKDANGRCRVAYWATGRNGQSVEPIGDLSADDAARTEFRGPREFGGATYLLPAIRDFVAYINQLTAGGERVGTAVGIVVTDGQLHDFDDLMAYTRELAKAIVDEKFPRTLFTLVGVGPQVDEGQMEALMHEATPEDFPGREIWCYSLAAHVGQLPELITHLVDQNVPAFWGGATVADDAGKVVLAFEDMVPGLIEFSLPDAARSFTLTVGDQSYTQPISGIPVEDDDR